MQIKEGLLTEVAYLSSPHVNDRPLGMPIDMIVVHGISLPPGEFGHNYIDDLFCGRLDVTAHPYFQSLQGLRVSAHLLIRRSGEIRQYVPFHRRAWHAGESSFAGRTVCNDFSIGIELEGTDELPYEEAQYQALAEVIVLLQATYPAITSSRIVGHQDVAPGRKTDPGLSFDWCHLREVLQSLAMYSEGKEV